MTEKRKFSSIDEYIDIFPKNIQNILQRVRKTIKKAAKDSSEVISYNMPAFKYKGKILVYFAAWKNHIGFYALPSGNVAFKKELANYRSAKGSIQFPFDKEIPYELIEKMVLYRKKELEK